ncbi:murein hydrolase activator EnvC family protein [Mariprofundus ferrooxydans]|uniref:Putative NlpD-related protein family M37 unassigned peptidase (NlpD protein) n=1 Tax=Mariprofundus ferrooxydans PV-1 TaxID=314345 RepID=Q0F1E6_9PROT|nr:peptidoglycan DD-metalloendopeptidase family protein [Mariprofundus ferrooxydans]EAU55245.1 putative NlpD-related protein family M37 unassigned peptidase (NlpD protein) [Mariprofundus ferrooxydans PV-1]KON47230.1 NlpD-related protein family M37 unassigned peptidase (NlpD protein) [Mariprofundus ferrooxydans]
MKRLTTSILSLAAALAVVMVLISPSIAAAGITTKQKIEQIKLERQRLAKLRHSMEQELGSIGRELKELDTELIAARRASRDVRASIRVSDHKLANLEAERADLQRHIETLKQTMMEEAVAAWQRSSRSSPWMGILTGVPVSDIPHRRFLLNVVMQAQQKDRQEYLKSVEHLAHIEADLKQQRDQLTRLHEEKKRAEAQLEARVRDKRNLVKRVNGEMRASKRHDSQLAREEKALLRLLQGISEDIVAGDNPGSVEQIRKRKGRLPWPLRGRIVASYHSRPLKGMPRLQGVQLKPDHGAYQVKAMGAGQVRYADWFGGYGLMIIVDYGEGILGVYAHNEVLYKQLGDWVEAGEVLADSGSTGWVSRQLLYFEIRDKGKPVNPKYWCRR